MYTDMTFSPGYNNGQDGPLCRILVAVAKVPDGYLTNCANYFDYALMRFAFNDPSGHNYPLQAYLLGWIETNVPTAGFGYLRVFQIVYRYNGTAVLEDK